MRTMRMDDVATGRSGIQLRGGGTCDKRTKSVPVWPRSKPVLWSTIECEVLWTPVKWSQFLILTCRGQKGECLSSLGCPGFAVDTLVFLTNEPYTEHPNLFSRVFYTIGCIGGVVSMWRDLDLTVSNPWSRLFNWRVSIRSKRRGYLSCGRSVHAGP